MRSKDRFRFTLLFTRFTLILRNLLHERFTRFTSIKVRAGHSFTRSFTHLHAPQLHAPLHAPLHALHVDQGTRRSQLHARFTHSFTRPPSTT
jgi:hypothetical protein